MRFVSGTAHPVHQMFAGKQRIDRRQHNEDTRSIAQNERKKTSGESRRMYEEMGKKKVDGTKGGAREEDGGNKKSASRDAGKMSVKEGGRGKG